jgi:small RNA 2'-O-methyltransferase
MTTDLHRQRFAAVLDVVRASAARSVLDLGCGDGELTLALAHEPGIERLLGIDLDAAALEKLRLRLQEQPAIAAEVGFRNSSYLTSDPTLRGFEAVVMVETIEHIDPDRLSTLERAVFATINAPLVVVTTPNADFNPLLAVPEHRFRHPDHRFEWGRERFARWADGVARRNGYGLTLHDLGGSVPGHGGPSQMAVFRRPAPPT